MPWRTVILTLSVATIAPETALCARLMFTGLYKAYPRFFAFSLWLTGESIALAVSYLRFPRSYGYIWMLTRAIAVVLQSGAVLEIFGRWTKSYPGIGAFGRQLFWALTVIGIGCAAVTLPVDLSRSGWSVLYQAVSIINRGVCIGLAAFLLAMLAFFARYGGPVAANLLRHSYSMLAFLCANAVGYFATAAHLFRWADPAFPVVSFITQTYWIFSLRRTGEVQPSTVVTDADRERWDAAESWNQQIFELQASIKLRNGRLERRR